MNSTRSLSSRTDALLAKLGIARPRAIECGAEHVPLVPFGPRTVIKVLEPFLAHKTEAGAVKIVPVPEIDATIAAMHARLGATRFLIEEFVEHDLELLLGIRQTPEFGPTVTLGAGGVTAELLASVAIFAPGCDIDRALAGKPFLPLITGWRNQPPLMPYEDLRAFIARCLDVAADAGELEINPLVITRGGLVALDVLAHEVPPLAVQPPRPIGKIARLLHPRSVAVMGVSSTTMNPGRVLFDNYAGVPRTIIKRDAVRETRASSDAGDPSTSLGVTQAHAARPGVMRGVMPSEVEASPASSATRVPDISSLPEPVDLLIMAIPADDVPDAIDDVVLFEKAESVVIIPGGLGEREGSESLERRVRDTLTRSRATAWRGPVVNGANCLGVNKFFLPAAKTDAGATIEKPLAIVSQSGALAATLAMKLAPVAPRHLVSVGNQIDLTVGDYLEYFSHDPELAVAAFYVEGFEPLDGARWLEAARRMAHRGGRVVLYRAGRTPAGKSATSSHTASIAGDAVATRELALSAGVLVADTLDDFEDLVRVATLLADRDKPASKRIGAMSNAGFETVAIADNLGALTFAELTAHTREAIADVVRESHLDRIVEATNPLDVNPMLADEPFARAASLLLADPNVDSAVIGCIPITAALQTLSHELESDKSIVNRLTNLWHRTTRPWVCVVDSSSLYDAMAVRLSVAGVPVFRSADRAVRALEQWICGGVPRHAATD